MSPDNKFKRYRQSAKGQEAARRRNARDRAARAARRAARDSRLYRACSMGFDGRYGGPTTPGVPRLGQIDLRAFKVPINGTGGTASNGHAPDFETEGAAIMQIQELNKDLTELIRAVMAGTKPAFTLSEPVTEDSRCVWCGGRVGSGRLSDGEVVDFDLEAEGDEWRIEFSKPHRCSAEPSDDPDYEISIRDLAVVEADEQDSIRRRKEISPAAAALRARFMERR